MGNFKLRKHWNNNEVLKALCNEAGWTVEPVSFSLSVFTTNLPISFYHHNLAALV